MHGAGECSDGYCNKPVLDLQSAAAFRQATVSIDRTGVKLGNEQRIIDMDRLFLSFYVYNKFHLESGTHFDAI